MHPVTLCGLLDEKIVTVIDELRTRANMSPVDFNGTVTGFLIKTGIYLAAKNNCPIETLRSHVNSTITEAYLCTKP